MQRLQADTKIKTDFLKLLVQMRENQKSLWCLLTFQMFGCKVARRGFWGSSGSLHNSSSTFHHLGSYGFPSRTHLCLVMIGRETERKVSEKSNSWITIQSIFKENCVSTVKVQVMYKRFGFLFFVFCCSSICFGSGETEEGTRRSIREGSPLCNPTEL